MAKADTEIEETTDEATELPPAQEDRIVDRVIAAVKDIVGKPAEVIDEEIDEEPEKVTKEPVTVREIETDMEAQVRAALHKIGAEEEHAKQHEKIKVEAERPPVTVGRVTRALWGTGE